MPDPPGGDRSRPRPGQRRRTVALDGGRARHPGRGRRDVRPRRGNPPGEPRRGGARPGRRSGAGRRPADGPAAARAARGQPRPGRGIEAVPRPLPGGAREATSWPGATPASTSAEPPTRRSASCSASWPTPILARPATANPYWARIGYRPDAPPLTERPTPIRPAGGAPRAASTPTWSWSARVPGPAWSPASWPRPAARSSSSRPGRSSPSPRCRRTSWPRSTGSTLITA